jgi:hypothetical protein
LVLQHPSPPPHLPPPPRLPEVCTDFLRAEPARNSNDQVIAVGEHLTLSMSPPRIIRHVSVDNGVAQPWGDRDGNMGHAVLGRSPGTARIVLADTDGHSETHVVHVRRLVRCPLGAGQFEFDISEAAIVRANVADGRVAAVDVLPVRRRGVRVTGLAPGRTTVALTDVDGGTEIVAVYVEVVDRVEWVGTRHELRMSGRQPMRWVRTDGDTTVLIETTDSDQTRVWLRAVGAGVAEVTMTDAGGRTERVRIGVRK